jgi:hypothetical protein
VREQSNSALPFDKKIVGRETKKRLEWKGKAIYLASMLLCSAAREKNGEDGIGRQVI